MSIEIIAEIANAHQGNYKEAFRLGLAADKANADAIKYQIYFAEEFLSKDHPRYDHFKKQSFSEKQWSYIIRNLKKKINKKLYADVFGVKAFKLSQKLKFDGIKIHSSDLSNLHLLELLRNYKKKIFISCGGSTFFEINNSLKKLDSNKITLLHGFQSYPTSVQDINLNRLIQIKNYFKKRYEYGYQDHTSGSSNYNIYLPLLSLGIGVSSLEKHITFNRHKKGVDYFSSIEPNKFKNFVEIIRNIESSFGKKTYEFSRNEIAYRKTVKKNWVSLKNVKKKNKIKTTDFAFLRSSKDLNPLNLEDFLGRRLIKNLNKNEILTKDHFKNKICFVVVARSKSKRLPNKALLKIGDTCVLEHLFKRLKSNGLKNIIFCTTKKSEDIRLTKIARKNKIKFYRGSEKNVLDRMMIPLNNIKPDIVVRITGDDILFDYFYFKKALNFFLKNNFDYVDHKNLLSGAETEIIDFKVLNFIHRNFKDLDGTEYLTNYIVHNKDFFNIGSAPVSKKHLARHSMTIDTKEDYIYVKKFIEKYYKKNNDYYNYTMDDLIDYVNKNPKKKIKASKKIENLNISLKN